MKELTAQQKSYKKQQQTNVQVWLNRDLHKLISEKAKQHGTSLSYALNKAVEQYIKKEQQS